MISEKNTVDRAIEIEDRMEFINSKLVYLEHLLFDYGVGASNEAWVMDEIDDLNSELSDLQSEYRG